MLNLYHDMERRTRPAFSTMALFALAGIALLGAGGEAQARYTCVENVSQIGNIVTMELVAISGGGLSGFCTTGKSIGTSPANISISGSVLSIQVGATNDGSFASAVATPQGLGSEFRTFCTHSASGGTCTSSDSGHINGVSFVGCRLTGVPFFLPDPALPLVPVTFTTTCTINY